MPAIPGMSNEFLYNYLKHYSRALNEKEGADNSSQSQCIALQRMNSFWSNVYEDNVMRQYFVVFI